MSRIVYFSPFENPGNAYVDRQKALWRAIGFEVQPFTLRLLTRPDGLRGIFNSHNVIVLHWLESRPFLNLKPGSNFRLKGLCIFFVYCVVLSMARARTVQFVHNHHVHDAPTTARRFSARLTRWLGKIVDVRVVHDPASAANYRAVYLPHPLYRELDSPQQSGEKSSHVPLFGTLGAIRPYKGIDRLLQAWPLGENLLIAGSASPATIAALTDIIVQRGLKANVSTDFKFLSQTEFNDYLDRIDVLILPHTSESILVSGAFFEAIGRVPVLLARRSSFSVWAQTQIPDIYLFDDDLSLAAMVAHIRASWPFQNSAPAYHRVDELFGWNMCRDTYARALAG